LVLDPDSPIEDYDDVGSPFSPIIPLVFECENVYANDQWPFDIDPYLVRIF
jgi:hypothetical protein